jgi:hypothetical protein
MRIAVAVLAVWLLAPFALAQTADPALEKARTARAAALRAGDDQGWGRYTTDDFMVTGPNGVLTKTQRMAEIKGNKQPAAKTTDLKTRAYGNAAIFTWRGEGGPNGLTRFTEVWVN